MKEKVQSFGRFLSGMVMPNIGAFIAWGLITALFIAAGWFPNEQLATMVSPMLSYVLPVLIVHVLGGIHEIYFPYVLMNPLLLLATIGGSVAAMFFNTLFNVGLVSPASPGSILAMLAVAPRGGQIMVILSFLIATAVSFVIAAPIVKMSNRNAADADSSDFHGGVLLKKNIVLNNAPVDKETAIRTIGQMLVDSGYVTEKYVDGMVAKEDVFNTAIGNNLAIPHGIESVIGEIKNSGLAIMTYPEGIDWGDNEIVKLVIAVASAGDDHVETLGKIAMTCESEEAVEKILHMSVDEIYELFKA